MPPGSRSNLIDFPDEDKKVFARYYERKVKPQVRELLRQYGPIGVMWFDTPEKISKEESRDLLAMIQQLQPGCIVNARIGNGLGDYGTPEQEIPSVKSAKAWETCMTMNRHWGYNKFDQNWKSTGELLRNLIDIASKGGNYLLNVGPTGEGLFPQPSLDRLAEIGKWMKDNGESIYGTTASPFAKLDWGRATRKGNVIYLHVFDWPKVSKLVVPLKSKVQEAELLRDHKELKTSSAESGLIVEVPPMAPDTNVTVIKLILSEDLKFKASQ